MRQESPGSAGLRRNRERLQDRIILDADNAFVVADVGRPGHGADVPGAAAAPDGRAARLPCSLRNPRLRLPSTRETSCSSALWMAEDKTSITFMKKGKELRIALRPLHHDQGLDAWRRMPPKCCSFDCPGGRWPDCRGIFRAVRFMWSAKPSRLRVQEKTRQEQSAHAAANSPTSINRQERMRYYNERRKPESVQSACTSHLSRKRENSTQERTRSDARSSPKAWTMRMLVEIADKIDQGQQRLCGWPWGAARHQYHGHLPRRSDADAHPRASRRR